MKLSPHGLEEQRSHAIVSVDCIHLYCSRTHLTCRLVAGDVDGNFKQLFNRIETILKKSGPFEVTSYNKFTHKHSQLCINTTSDATLCWFVLQ